MQNVGSAATRTVEAGSEKSLKQRALSELEKYAVITVYLWLLSRCSACTGNWSKGMGSASGIRASPS